ncbi:MAG: DMT family transporter [Bacilli bacterium]|nr:DMT family transporter [Bacilli bacterium]
MNEAAESRKTALSYIGMVLVVVLWGLAPLAGKYLFDESAYSPALLIACRGLVSAVVLGLFLLFTGRFKKMTKAYWICLPAGLIMGLAYLFQFIGLESTSLSKNTFLESFSVVAVPITMFVLVRSKPSVTGVVSAISCLFGCFILCGHGWDFSAFFTAPTLGDIFSAIGGALFGVNIAFTKVFSKNKDPYVFVFFQLAVMTVISFAYALPFEKGLTFSWSWNHLLVLLFLSLVCTVGCWVMRTICIRRVSALTCAVINPMSAVIAASLSIALAMEPFSWNVIAGGALITISILLAGIIDAKHERHSKLSLENV